MPDRSYVLTVEGELSDRLGQAFAGMTLTCSDGRTIISAPDLDQAQLFGLLQQISDLGLTLLNASTTDESIDPNP